MLIRHIAQVRLPCRWFQRGAIRLKSGCTGQIVGRSAGITDGNLGSGIQGR
jgi:hypothetical protein